MMSSLVILVDSLLVLLPVDHGSLEAVQSQSLGFQNLANGLQTLENSCLIDLVVRPLSEDRTVLISNWFHLRVCIRPR